MEQPDPSNADARSLRLLRVLVLILTGSMIVGMVTLIVLFITRFPKLDSEAQAPFQAMRLPDSIALPDGASPLAITQGPGWWAVVTDGNDILIFDAADGTLRQTVKVE